MVARRREEPAQSTMTGGPALASLARAACGGGEESLHRAALLMASWPGVRAVTIEVYPEASGRATTLVTETHEGCAGARGGPSFQIDLVERGRCIGQVRVHFDEFDLVPAPVVAWCQDGAAILVHIAARYRMEALLLDAQCHQMAGQIAAGLVHDFNNMLTGIMGTTAMLLAAMDRDAPAVAGLRRIEEAAIAAAHVSRALLNFVRGTLERGPVAVNDLATATQQVMSRVLRDGVALYLDLEPDLPPVEGERALIQQALVNLVLNGAEAITGDGSVTIRTRLLAGAPAAHLGVPVRASAAYVALSVADTGGGVAPEHLGDLFRPFFTTKGRGGTGLGLASVARIAQRHGGTVGVESRLGLGSTFTIYLPTREEPESPPEHLPATADGLVGAPTR